MVIGWRGQHVDDAADNGTGEFGCCAQSSVHGIDAPAEIDRESLDAVTGGLDAVSRASRDGADRGVHFENALGERRDQESTSGRVKRCRSRSEEHTSEL